MLKNCLPKLLLVFLAALVLSGTVSAAIRVVLPVEAQLSNKDQLDFGNAALGETFSVVIQKKSGEGFDWDSISVNAPNNWIVAYRISDKTLIADITIPRNWPESVQVINFFVSSLQKHSLEESFNGVLTVKRTLLTVAMDNLKQETVVGKAISYKFIASNDSIAEHRLIIQSSLPNYWFAPVEVAMLPKQKQELTLSLTPKAYGLRAFSFFVKSEQSDFSKQFVSELQVSPTLQGKFLASAYAMPFFTISNFPYYLLNSLLAMPFS